MQTHHLDRGELALRSSKLCLPPQSRAERALMKTAATVTTMLRVTMPRRWWQEMLLADFQNAFWAWLAYATSTLILVLDPYTQRDLSFVVMAGFSFLSPAVISAIFGSDFSHRTIDSLLSFGRPRGLLFSARCVLAATLVYSPPFLFLPIFFNLVHAGNYDLNPTLLLIGFIITTCQLGVAPLLVQSLKKPLVAWTAIVLAPVAFIITWSLVETILQLELVNDRFENFPNVSISYTIATLSAALVCFLISCRQWLRLEVRL